MRALLPVIACLALISCGSGDKPANQAPQGEPAVDNATVTQLSLISEAFEEGERIPVQYTCDGHDEAPALSWGEPPAGTRSFALVVDDPEWTRLDARQQRRRTVEAVKYVLLGMAAERDHTPVGMS